jgi:hypothetical protein
LAVRESFKQLAEIDMCMISALAAQQENNQHQRKSIACLEGKSFRFKKKTALAFIFHFIISLLLRCYCQLKIKPFIKKGFCS